MKKEKKRGKRRARRKREGGEQLISVGEGGRGRY
jgi:hypothetical protein